MTTAIPRILGALVIVFLTLAAMAERSAAQTPKSAAAEFSDAQQQAAIEKIIRGYLLKNPEILIELTTELERKQRQGQTAQRQDAIKKNATAIFRSPSSFVAGNPDGDVTVVEFFDYDCGYCRRAMPDVLKLIKSDKKVRLVFKEFPILGRGSAVAARASMAAKRQGKYLEFHRAMFETPGRSSNAKILRVAKELGMDVEKLKKDMADKSIQTEISADVSLAQALGIQGTPFFLVGNQSIPGAPDDLFDTLTRLVKDVRKKGCAYC